MRHSWNRFVRNAALVAGSYAAWRTALALSRRYDFQNRLVVITGGSRGLGLLMARQLADEGAALVLCARDDEELAVAADELRERASFVATYTSDLSDRDDIAKLFARIRREIGSVDVLINNAGIFSTLEMRPFDQIPLEEWEKVLRVNLTGPFLCARAVLPAMRRAKWGRIINVASGAVRLGRPNYLHYIATKAALAGMSLSMARELGADGITVNAILPGATFTEIERKTVTPAQKERIIAMQCVPRAEVPEDLVGAVLFLASEASSFVTGQSINLDGGVTGS